MLSGAIDSRLTLSKDLTTQVIGKFMTLLLTQTSILISVMVGFVLKQGTPGVWEQMGIIKPFHSYIEELDYLPDPSILQLGRQVRYTQGGKQGLFICKYDGENPVWAQQDFLTGSTAERPGTAINGTWYYNTSVDRWEWYSVQASRWFRLEQLEEEISGWQTDIQGIIDNYNSHVDLSIIIWRTPVDEYSDLAIVYPTPCKWVDSKSN